MHATSFIRQPIPSLLLPTPVFQSTSKSFPFTSSPCSSSADRQTTALAIAHQQSITEMAPRVSREVKLYAAHLVMDGVMTIEEAASTHDISVSTIRRAIAQLKRTGRVSPAYTSTGRPSKLTERHRRYILALVHHQPTIYMDEVASMLRKYHGLSVSTETIRKFLHDAGFTNKAVNHRAIQRDAEQRRWHMLLFAQLDPGQLVFADESHTSRRTSLRQRGWSRKGQPAVQISLFMHHKRYTLLPALANDGILAPWVVEGSVNAERFRYWVEYHLLPLMSPYPGPKSVLVVDNCSTHKNTQLRELVEGKGCHLVFLPKYSPDLNPIEYAFAAIKRRIKRSPVTHEYDVLKACYDSVSPAHAAAYFRAGGYGRRDYPA